MGYLAKLRVWRGDAGSGELKDYKVEVNEGEVVLDVLHRLQATQASDLAIRWNCKAGKCGSCSMEINGMPRLGCMRRMSPFSPGGSHPVVHAGPIDQAGRVPDAAGGRGPVAGVPQVH